MNRKIDCHTHIVNTAIRDAYYAKTEGYAIIMEFPNIFRDIGIPDDAFSTAKSDSRLFLCPAINIHEDIPPQLAAIESRLDQYPIVGVKIYLTYQSGRADSPHLMPVYDFCSQHGLSVTYHTGSCSLVLPTDNDMEGSNAKYVQNAALKYPDVNFILAHMDDPRFDECIRIVHETDNLFTDFSGAYEPGTKEGADMDWAINTFAKAIHQYPDTYKKILYGTDFCPPINLSAIEEYDVTIRRIFSEDQLEDIYFNNCLRAFPKLSHYISK